MGGIGINNLKKWVVQTGFKVEKYYFGRFSNFSEAEAV